MPHPKPSGLHATHVPWVGQASYRHRVPAARVGPDTVDPERASPGLSLNTANRSPKIQTRQPQKCGQ